MIDLERELRATLEERGRLAPAPADIRRAIRVARRRQVGVIMTALAVIAAVAVGSIAGVSALMRSEPTPARPDEKSAPGPLETVVVGSFNGSFSMTVDSDGAVWTVGPGLTRFNPDSNTIDTFTLADDPAFQHVASIAPAREGGLWVVPTSDEPAIRRFDGELFQESLGPGPVCGIVEAPDGTLWGTGCSGGLFRWDGGWVSAPAGGPAGGDWIAVDATGDLWVASASEIWRFDGTRWTGWTEEDGLPPGGIETLAPQPGGAVWVGTSGGGVARFFDSAWVAYPSAQTVVQKVTSIAETAEDVWIAGPAGQIGWVARFDGEAWEKVTSEDGLGSIGAHPTVAAGRQGVVWASGYDLGLFQHDGSEWQNVAPGSPHWPWGEIVGAASDEVWSVGDGSSFSPLRLRSEILTSFATDPGLPVGRLNGIAVGSDGVVWVTSERGLARFDGTSWEQIPSGRHPVVAFGPDGRVWMASGGGDSQTIAPIGGTPLPGPAPLRHEVTHLGIGPGGEVWASCWHFYGGEDCGLDLAHFDGRTWMTVRPPQTSGEPWLVDLEVTQAGDVWVSAVIEAEALQPLVVFRYRDGTWTEFREADLDVGFELQSAEEAAPGTLDSTPDGTVLLVTAGGVAAYHGDSWSAVVEGTFHALSVAPDGTVWLAGDGLFRMRDI